MPLPRSMDNGIYSAFSVTQSESLSDKHFYYHCPESEEKADTEWDNAKDPTNDSDSKHVFKDTSQYSFKPIHSHLQSNFPSRVIPVILAHIWLKFTTEVIRPHERPSPAFRRVSMAPTLFL
jgi:hypothetical protein